MPTKPKKDLGRGLEALMGASNHMNDTAHEHTKTNPAGDLRKMFRDKMQPGKYQPRSH